VRRESIPVFHNRLWVADLTPLPVFDRPYFLCVVLDAYSGRCQGWRFSRRLDPELVSSAVSAALRNCWPAPFRPTLTRPVALALGRRFGVTGLDARSQIAPGDAAESIASDFFRWLDADLIASTGWPNQERAMQAIEHWIVTYYNPAVSSPSVPAWPHGLMSPNEEERRSA
jgi:transposase InsO family protein